MTTMPLTIIFLPRLIGFSPDKCERSTIKFYNFYLPLETLDLR